MKKLICLIALLCTTIAISSCDYDDSNDIDIIIPKDSMQGKEVVRQKP